MGGREGGRWVGERRAVGGREVRLGKGRIGSIEGRILGGTG